jgi:hypothetical protein
VNARANNGKSADADGSGAIDIVRAMPISFRVSRYRNLIFDGTLAGHSMHASQHESVNIVVERAKDGHPVQVSLDITGKYAARKEGDAPEEKELSPLSGRRFTITREVDNSFLAIDFERKAVSPEDRQLLEDEFADLVGRDDLPKVSFRIGEPLGSADPAVAQMLGLNNINGDTRVDLVELTLQTVENEQARFDVKVSISVTLPGGTTLRGRLVGWLSIDTKIGWFTGTDLTGALVELDSRDGGATCGNLRFEQHLSFPHP